MSHQFKPLQQWIFKLKWAVLVTSMSIGLVISESAWASCTQLQGYSCQFYCDVDHLMYSTATDCPAACGSVVPLPTCTSIITYTLTLNTSGSGTGTVSGGGSYAEGTEVNLIAIGDPESVFVGWSEEGCDNTLILKENTTCTAKFEKIEPPTPGSTSSSKLPDYLSLTIQIAGSGSGSVSTNTGLYCTRQDCQTNSLGEVSCNEEACSGRVTTASTVTLTPQADQDSVFSSWGGHEDCIDEEVFMSGGRLCIAYFHMVYELTVVTTGQGKVMAHSASRQPQGIDCGEGNNSCSALFSKGMTTYLQAIPSTDMKFLGWGGDCQGLRNPLAVNISKDMTCEAHFGTPTPVAPPPVTPPAVVKQGQAMTQFAPKTPAVVNSNATLTATGGASGQPVVFASTTPAVCTVSGSVVTFITVGICTVTANQAGNDQYDAAPTVTANLDVTSPVVVTPPDLMKSNQIITAFSLVSLASPVAVGDQMPLAATGGASGKPVTYRSITPTVCTVSGDKVIFRAAGICTVTADQAGNDQYHAAPTVTATLEVNLPEVVTPLVPDKANQVITQFSLANLATGPVVGDQMPLTATGGASGQPVTYSSTTPTICTVSGDKVIFRAAGICTVTADQAGNDQYDAAPTVTASLTVQANSATTATSSNSQTGLETVYCNFTERDGIEILPGPCNAHGQVFSKPMQIESGGSLSEAILDSKVNNRGLISSSTIASEGTVNCGLFTGVIKNEGTLTNFEFIGNSFEGGTVGGNIQNSAKFNVCLKDITLLPGTIITEGCVAGVIKGDGTLKNVTISEGTQVQGNSYAGNIVNYGTLIDPIVLPDGQIDNYGTLENPILLPGSHVIAGQMSGTIIALGTYDEVTVSAGSVKIITQLKDIPPALFNRFNAQTLAALPKCMLSQISSAQLAQVSTQSVSAPEACQ